MTPLAIEHATIAAWPAAITEEHDGWFHLAAGGVTGRVNAVWPLAWRGKNLDDAILRAQAWFTDRGLPCRFKITDGAYEPAGLIAALRARGFTPTPLTTVMTKPLTRVAHDDPGVELDAHMTPAFERVIAETSANEAEFDERRGIALRAPAARAFAILTQQTETGAIGMSAIAGGLAGVFLMRTRSEARRQGLARRILRRLLAWAADAGATHAFLQVESDNLGAVELYRAEGFTALTHYCFWRREPLEAEICNPRLP